MWKLDLTSTRSVSSDERWLRGFSKSNSVDRVWMEILIVFHEIICIVWVPTLIQQRDHRDLTAVRWHGVRWRVWRTNSCFQFSRSSVFRRLVPSIWPMRERLETICLYLPSENDKTSPGCFKTARNGVKYLLLAKIHTETLRSFNFPTAERELLVLRIASEERVCLCAISSGILIFLSCCLALSEIITNEWNLLNKKFLNVNWIFLSYLLWNWILHGCKASLREWKTSFWAHNLNNKNISHK